MSNQYVLDVEWAATDFEQWAKGMRKRVLINDAEFDEYPNLSVEDILHEKYDAAVKSYQVVRVIGDGPNRFAAQPPVQGNDQLTAVMELDMDFVQNLITALNAAGTSVIPAGTKRMMRNQLDELQEQLMHSNELWVIAR